MDLERTLNSVGKSIFVKYYLTLEIRTAMSV